jgi:hypothetical protein
MRLQDVLNFDAAGYATKIATYDDSRLCNNEVVKLRQKTGSAASMIGGVVMIGVTGPSCLFSIAYNARRYDIASHKRKLIRTEMTERGLAHHSLTTADVLVPVATLAINMALDTAASSAITHAADTAHQTTITHTPSLMNNLPRKAGMWMGTRVTHHAVEKAVGALSRVENRSSRIDRAANVAQD